MKFGDVEEKEQAQFEMNVNRYARRSHLINGVLLRSQYKWEQNRQIETQAE